MKSGVGSLDGIEFSVLCGNPATQPGAAGEKANSTLCFSQTVGGNRIHRCWRRSMCHRRWLSCHDIGILEPDVWIRGCGVVPADLGRADLDRVPSLYGGSNAAAKRVLD